MAIIPDQPVLVGRERERQTLLDALDRAAGGQGSLVLISGEAGIGKTSLVDDLTLRMAARDVLALSGAAYEVTASPPYGPWVEIIEALPDDGGLPPLPDQLRPGGGMAGIDSQAALFELASRYLASVAAARPLALLLEDLHWADPASLDLLRHLSRTLAGEPVLIVATYRDDEITPGHHLFELLPPMLREGRVERLPLQRLEREAVLELIRERYRLSGPDETRLMSYLERLAEGNPFFINELLYTLAERQILRPVPGGWELGDLGEASVPSLIQQVINGRLARIDPDARELLDTAAIIGYDVALDLVRQLHEGPDAALDGALQQALDHHLVRMRAHQRSVRFSHALVRQTIYEAIPPLRRQALHRRVGDLLADRPRPDLSTVANHLYEAGNERALEWLQRAAEQAQSLYAPEAVIAQSDRLLDLAGRIGISVPLAVYRLRGLARESLGDFDGAREDHEMALELARERGDERAEWQALLDLGASWASRDYDEARRYCEEAVAHARSMGDPVALGHSLNRLGNLHANGPRVVDALPLHEEALKIFGGINDIHGLGTTHDLLAIAYYLHGDAPRTVQHFEQAIPLLRKSGDQLTLSSAMTNVVGSSIGEWGRPIQSLQDIPLSLGSDHVSLLNEAVDIARSTGWRSGEAFSTAISGFIAASGGDLRKGLAELEQALLMAQSIEHHHWTGQISGRLGFIYHDLRLPGLAHQFLAHAREMGSVTASRTLEIFAISLLASSYVQDGNLEAADALLESTRSFARSLDTGNVGGWERASAELALARNQSQRALGILDDLIASIPVSKEGELNPDLRKLRGEILIARGQFDDAEAELRRAGDVTKHFGHVIVRWHVFALLCRLYTAQGRADDAQSVRDVALEIVNHLEGQLDDEELRAEFLANARSLIPGAAPYRPDREATYAGLTPREIEVLQAVAEGLTDAEAGERLYIATRTVSQHLRSVYNKLGVSNRAAAVRIAVEQGLV